MVMCTPTIRYNVDRAAALLHGIGEELVTNAQNSLLERGTLSKLVRDVSKQRPGRTLKISDA
jgi:oxalate---CoA ligase